MQRLKLFVPLLAFALVAVLFLIMQQRIQSGDYDPQALPAARLDQPLPAFLLPDLRSDAMLTEQAWQGEVALINVWATWCPSCHYEHPYLMQLAEQGVVIYGVDYKDDTASARTWLAEKGDPYRSVVEDRSGRLGLDLGVTGAPETYVVDRNGVIRFRYQGPLDERVWKAHFEPLLAQLNDGLLNNGPLKNDPLKSDPLNMESRGED